MKQTKTSLEILSFSVWDKSAQVSTEIRVFAFPCHKNPHLRRARANAS